MNMILNKSSWQIIISDNMHRVKKLLSRRKFTTSKKYWEHRYRSGGNSGAGSYDHLAEYKAMVINKFAADRDIKSVIELGCGDGNQLSYFHFDHYIGYDVSSTAIDICRKKFRNDPSKEFYTMDYYKQRTANLVLSLDVIYHLVEDETFNEYMIKLFESSSKFIIIYSSNSETHENNGVSKHVVHRKFTDWIDLNRPEFKLIEHTPNKYPFDGDPLHSSYADFYFYEKN